MSAPTVDDLGRMAYGTYGNVTDHKNYQGDPMPDWYELGDTIRQAWCSAAATCYNLGYADSGRGDAAITRG